MKTEHFGERDNSVIFIEHTFFPGSGAYDIPDTLVFRFVFSFLPLIFFFTNILLVNFLKIYRKVEELCNESHTHHQDPD